MQQVNVLYVAESAAAADRVARHCARHAPHLCIDAVLGIARLLRRAQSGALAFDVLLLADAFPEPRTLGALNTLRAAREPGFPLILLTRGKDAQAALRAMRLGATGRLAGTPESIRQLPALIDAALARTRTATAGTTADPGEAGIRELLASVPGAVYAFRIDAGGRRSFPFVTDGFVDLTGVSRTDLARDADAVFRLVRPGDRRVLERAIAESTRDLSPWVQELYLRTPAGEDRWLRGHAMPRREPDGATFWVGVITDLTRYKHAEEVLIGGEERWRQAVRVSGLGIFDHDHRSDSVYWSPEQRNIYDVDEQTPIDLPLYLSRLHPEDGERVAAAVKRAHDPAGDGQFDVEHRIVLRDGRVRWIMNRSQTLFEGEGEARRPVRTVGAALDITERKLSEATVKNLNEALEARVAERTAALGDALELNRHILDAASFGIAAYRASGECVFANAAHANTIGATVEQVLAQNFRNVQSWQRHGLLQHAIDVLATGRTWHGEFHIVTTYGRALWADFTFVRFMRSGQPHLLTLLRDVTDRRHAEAQLQVSEEQFRVLAESSPVGIVRVGAGGHLYYANPAYAAILGRTPEQCLGQGWRASWHPEDSPRIEAQVGPTLARHDRVDVVHRIVRPDGEVRWIRSRGAPALKEGSLLWYMFVVEDITEHRKAEQALIAARDEAEHASRAKSEFLGRMSHELRTPLNAILGFAQVLAREKLAERHQGFVREIDQAGEYLLDLIEDLLDLSRIEAGKLLSVVEPVALTRVVHEAVRMAHRHIQAKTVDVLNRIDIAGGQSVFADPTRLRQILVNLLSNAAKYNRVGGKIVIDCMERDAQTLRLSISDSGPGIAPEHLSRLFTPFERLGAERSGVDGAGIGLALCKRLAEAMGCALGVASLPGQGSTFWIDIPRAQRAVAEAQSSVAAAGETAPAGSAHTRSRKLLYVEDNAANLHVVQALLDERPGIALLTATNGEYGLEVALRDQPEAILLDIHLPGMDGYALLRELRTRAETRNIPVIALSADAMPIDIERGLRAGFDYYLTKPLKVAQLFAAIEKCLDGAVARP